MMTSKLRLEWIVSIPRSGFCSFKPLSNTWLISATTVSIPRSGFCSFKLIQLPAAGVEASSFNPSVGILFIQAPSLSTDSVHLLKFQSLGRDSVHSSSHIGSDVTRLPSVSIPRSGFCSFKHTWCSRTESLYWAFQSLGRDSVHSSSLVGLHLVEIDDVSIPRSGFCSFKLLLGFGAGLLVVLFQSLGRDSVHSS